VPGVVSLTSELPAAAAAGVTGSVVITSDSAGFSRLTRLVNGADISSLSS